MAETARPWEGGRSLIKGGLIAAAVGLILWIIALIVDTRHALFAYLTAYAYVTTTLVGALIFLMAVHAARAEWPVAFRPLIERIVALLPLMILLFLPIAIGIKHIYVWAGAEEAGEHLQEVMRHQRPYLNVPFSLVRAGFFLGLWSLMASRLIHWSRQLAQSGDPAWKERQWRLSGIGLVIMAITLTLFSIDWLMSLTPSWFSTIFGFYIFAGGFVAAFALIVLLMVGAERAGPLAGFLQSGHYLSMGKLILAHIIFWAYMAYAQYLIIWIGDIPHEASWWVTRSDGWAGVSILLGMTHFVVPFFILLWRDMKRWRGHMAAISVWVLLVHYLDMYWLTMPALNIDGPHLHWADVAAPLFVIGVTVAFGAWRTRGKHLVALRDPDLPVAIQYEGT